MVAGPEEVCKPHVHGCEIHKPQDLKRSRGFFRLGFFRLGFFRLGFFRLDTVVWALSFVRRVSQFSTGSTRRKYFKIRLFHVVQPPNGARRANGSKEKWS